MKLVLAGLVTEGLLNVLLAATTLAAAPPGTEGATPAPGADRRFAHTTETSVFGVTGQGSLFVYVFDRSDSMNDYQRRPLRASRAELIKSLQSLEPTQQFQILFYNSRVTAFNPARSQPPQLVFATEQNKRLAASFVEQVPGSNGTEHMGPLRMALRMGPDVIFFLTDAGEPQLTAADLDRLQRLNSGTVIHCIEFGVGPDPGGDNFLKRLAGQSGGQHVYVDVTRLPGQ